MEAKNQAMMEKEIYRPALMIITATMSTAETELKEPAATASENTDHTNVNKATLLTSERRHLTLILATFSVKSHWMIWPTTKGTRTVIPNCFNTPTKSTWPPAWVVGSSSGVASMRGPWKTDTRAGDTKMPK